MKQARLYDGQNAAGVDVRLAVAGNALQIFSEAGALQAVWPIRSLIRTDLDAPGEGATLRQAAGAARLVVPDGAVIAELRAQGARLGAARTHWGGRQWAGVTAAILAGVAGVALLVDRLPAMLVPFVPHRIERTWSGGIEAAMTATNRRCATQAGVRAVARLLDRLAAADAAPAPHFAIIDDDLVNAFTLPDGRIVILRGLIDKAGDPDEFAGVMAHELAHGRHRDPTREMLRGMMLNMLARSLGWGGSTAGQITALSYGRRAEAAADAGAVETLRRAGLHADGLGRFFAALQAEMGAEGLPAFLSTHPPTAARADALHIAPTGAPAMTPGEWEDVRRVCAQD